MKAFVFGVALLSTIGTVRTLTRPPHPPHPIVMKLEGRVETFFDSGVLATERYYHLGREVGTHRGWYANGARRFEYHYANGISEGPAYEWDAAGHLTREAHYLHGREEGLQRLWDANGQLRANYVMRDGIRYGRFGALGCPGKTSPSSVP